MEITLRTFLLLLTANHGLCDIEGLALAGQETISPMKYGLLHYAKLKLQSLITKLTEFTEEVQSLLSSVLEGLGERVNANELRLVAAVWRHGSRAPFKNVFRYPEDQLAAQWPRGLRELTEKGIQEQRLLGEFLRERYKEFMTNYTAETIYVRSSDSSRTIMSALATLSGFVPSGAEAAGEDDAVDSYQKIPIHKMPLKHDRTLEVTYVNCPPPYRPFIASLSKSSNDDVVSQIDPKLLHLLEYTLGKKPLETMDLYLFAEALISYDAPKSNEYDLQRKYYHDKESVLPQWARQPQMYEMVKKLYEMNLYKQQSDPQYRVLRGLKHEVKTAGDYYLQGLEQAFPNGGERIKRTEVLPSSRPGSTIANLFKEITDKFVKKSTEKEANKLQFIGYSAHDMTLLALLTDWGALIPSLTPGFSSCIMVELYERATVYYVEVWYVKGAGEKPVQLKVKGCREPCRLQEFVDIAETYASVNMTAYCEKFKALGLQFVDQKLT